MPSRIPSPLFEPIYHDGGDPIFVMDQISDDKQKDYQWVEELALKEALHKLNDREKMILSMRFLKEKPKWRWLTKSAYLKPRFRV